MIGRDDELSEREARRIQDKWRDLLDAEKDWPGHQNQYDIIVSSLLSLKDYRIPEVPERVFSFPFNPFCIGRWTSFYYTFN